MITVGLRYLHPTYLIGVGLRYLHPTYLTDLIPPLPRGVRGDDWCWVTLPSPNLPDYADSGFGKEEGWSNNSEVERFSTISFVI